MARIAAAPLRRLLLLVLLAASTAALAAQHPFTTAHATATAAALVDTLPPCYPFCSSDDGGVSSIESRRYPPSMLGNLQYTNPLIGTQGPDPAEYGGMVPSLASPFASTRLVPMTRENKVSGVPYHFNDTVNIGAIVTRQPAIWMGDYGHLALWSGARGQEVMVDVKQRGMRFDRKQDEYATVWKYAARLKDKESGEDQVYLELAGRSRAHMVQFSYPLLDDDDNDNDGDGEKGQGPAVTLQSSRAEWRGGVEIDVEAGQVSGYNTERMDFRLGPNQALDFKGYYVARFEHQLQGSSDWLSGFAHEGYGTVHTNSSGTTLHPSQRARWNDLGVYGYVRFPRRTTRVRVRIGLSLISKEQAEFNLEDEMPDGTALEDVVRHSIEQWRGKVDRIQTRGGEERDRTILHTAMVRTCVYPSEHAEVIPPREWRSRSARRRERHHSARLEPAVVNGTSNEAAQEDDKRTPARRRHHYYSAYTSSVHVVPEDEGTQRYQSWSIWDIYRAQWSTLILFEPERVVDMVRSLLDIYDQSGYLPMWANLGETNIMIGTHADSLIAEAVLKGVRGFDMAKAWEAVLKDATVPPEGETELRFSDREEFTPLEVRAGLSSYVERGYVDLDGWDESTSRTLDYAYDDAAVSTLARLLNKSESVTTHFEARSRSNWKNVFDPSTGMASARLLNGTFFPQPLATPQARQDGFTEGNMWDYTFAVPHDVKGLIDHVGKERLTSLLRRHFEEEHNNISNEPSQHIPMLFSYLGLHGEGHAVVRSILREGYGEREDGITGNEDCGQMSSWFVWNAAVGVYAVNPVGGEVVVSGGLAFDEVRIEIPARASSGGEDDENESRGGGRRKPKLLIIRASHGIGGGRVYTRGLTIDGVRSSAFVPWQRIVEGGEWVFDMREQGGEWIV